MIVGRSLIELKIAVRAYEPLSNGHVSDFFLEEMTRTSFGFWAPEWRKTHHG